MTKSELANDMKKFAGGGFITKQKLADYMGIKKQGYINRYVAGLERVDNKYYFIPDVADNICKRRTF